MKQPNGFKDTLLCGFIGFLLAFGFLFITYLIMDLIRFCISFH